ncbi:hypothetical protein OTU49_001205 [Cherax quadricarinatus]|uniref:Uncharacterized protein n=1 Tax=Cherax quadricarinatus TaxID=27406 RepID=A0AAW0XIK5_CHEQU
MYIKFQTISESNFKHKHNVASITEHHSIYTKIAAKAQIEKVEVSKFKNLLLQQRNVLQNYRVMLLFNKLIEWNNKQSVLTSISEVHKDFSHPFLIVCSTIKLH